MFDIAWLKIMHEDLQKRSKTPIFYEISGNLAKKFMLTGEGYDIGLS